MIWKLFSTSDQFGNSYSSLFTHTSIFLYAVTNAPWLNTGWHCAGWCWDFDSSRPTGLGNGECSSQSIWWSTLSPSSCISTTLAQSWAIFSRKKIWNPVSMTVHKNQEQKHSGRNAPPENVLTFQQQCT